MNCLSMRVCAPFASELVVKLISMMVLFFDVERTSERVRERESRGGEASIVRSLLDFAKRAGREVPANDTEIAARLYVCVRVYPICANEKSELLCTRIPK